MKVIPDRYKDVLWIALMGLVLAVAMTVGLMFSR